MPFQVSPGVNVTEIDLTTVVPAVSTTEGAIAGVFRWGPVDKRVLVDSENSLVNRFGRPTNFNPETFFTAANFLSYGNKLYAVRTANIAAATVTATIASDGVTNDTTIKLSSNLQSSIAVGDIAYSGDTRLTVSAIAAGANSTTSNVTFTGVANGLSSGIFANSGTLFFQQKQGAFSAIANVGSVSSILNIIVKNDDEIESNTVITNIASETNVRYIARYPGELGNSLKISVCDTSTAFFSNTILHFSNATHFTTANGELTFMTSAVGTNTVIVTVGAANTTDVSNTTHGVGVAVTYAGTLRSSLTVGDLIEVGNAAIGTQKLRVTSIGSVTNTALQATFTVNVATKSTIVSFGGATAIANVSTTAAGYLKRYWEYADSVEKAPGQSAYVAQFGNTSANDEVHAVIVDEDGQISGIPGTILEVYQGLSRASNAKSDNGTTIYLKDILNTNSRYVYYGTDRTTGYLNTATNIASLSNTSPLTLSFKHGHDGNDENDVTLAELAVGYDSFKSAEDVDVSLILQGKARGGTNGEQLANHLIDNIVEVRKDCVVFVSPDKADVVSNSAGNEAEDIITFRNSLTSTSYAVLDTGYKYQYDKYNDVYRFVPLNGDIAGLCVRTDDTRDPWYSPAGYNRGIIKNVVKLAFNPKKAQRDYLYKNGANPVNTFPGQGTLLFGDKTLLAKPSAFDRINVRRLFIVLEKAIATAAKFTLFEFNDEFTRAQFKNLIEPFLRDVQGRRGITDFKVVCDETNNTGEVIDRNEFIGDIYIKPARSINFIQLNFVAVRTGVEFSEIVGQF